MPTTLAIAEPRALPGSSPVPRIAPTPSVLGDVASRFPGLSAPRTICDQQRWDTPGRYRYTDDCHDGHRRAREPGRARDRRDDLRVVRRSDREAAQRCRWGHRRNGQLRDRDGSGELRQRRRRRGPDRRGRGGRLHRQPASDPIRGDGSARRRARSHRITSHSPDRLRGPEPAGGGDGDDPGPAVRQLAVAVAHADRPGRRVGCPAVPPRRVGEPAPRRGDDGHPDLDRHPRRVRVVAVRPVHRRRGHGRDEDAVRADDRSWVGHRSDLPRGGRRGDHVHPGWPVFRSAGEAAFRSGVESAARARRQGSQRAAWRP